MQPTHSSRRILLPVKSWFIIASIVLALILNLIPTGSVPAIPDWVALVLAFWSVREPLKIGMVNGFLLGLVMDVAYGTVLGQHALGYVLVMYIAAGFSRRILWFPLFKQALQVLPMLLAMQAVMVGARLLAGGAFPGWCLFPVQFHRRPAVGAAQLPSAAAPIPSRG